MATIGWRIAPDERARLLLRYPTRYDQTIADHVTLATGQAEDAAPPAPATGRVVGRADDGSGVEALVVTVDGESSRPGGGVFHVTWSLGEGRRARESNDVITARGWTPIDDDGLFALVPARWPAGLASRPVDPI